MIRGFKPFKKTHDVGMGQRMQERNLENNEKEKKTQNKLKGDTECIGENHLVLRALLFRLVDALERVVSEMKSGVDTDSRSHDITKTQQKHAGWGPEVAGGSSRSLQNAVLAAALVHDGSLTAPNLMHDAELVHSE